MIFNGKGPVLGIDVDGTLAEYHGHFLNFAQGWLGREMPDPSKINPGLPLHKFMGVSKSTYRRIKLAYRQGGLKRSMPAYEGARELTVNLRKTACLGMRAELIICTSRPYLQLGGIDPDTRHWLKRNGIQYDNIVWGENKYRDLFREYGYRVAGILDDLPPMIRQATDLGIPACLKDQPYNLVDRPHVAIARDLFQAEAVLTNMLHKWFETNSPFVASR